MRRLAGLPGRTSWVGAPALVVAVGVVLAACGGRGPELPPSVQRERVAVNGAPGRVLSYLRAGDRSARRVIYVHGTPGEALAWKSYLETPVAGTESIAVDRLGFGASQSSSRGNQVVTSFQEQAAAIESLLARRQERGTILVGHSLGGPIVCRIAAERPDLVAGVVVLAGSVDPELESWRWYNRLAGSPLVRWAVSRDMLVSNDEVRQAAAQESALVPLLAKIRCAVIVIHGSKDALVPVANAAWLRGKLTGAAGVQVRILEGEGHFLPWKREAEVRQAVAELLRRTAQ